MSSERPNHFICETTGEEDEEDEEEGGGKFVLIESACARLGCLLVRLLGRLFGLLSGSNTTDKADSKRKTTLARWWLGTEERIRQRVNQPFSVDKQNL